MKNDDEPQQQKTRVGVTGKGFVKGDPRINRSGRPRSFDELRCTAQQITAEPVIDAAGNSLTRIEQILRAAAAKRHAIRMTPMAMELAGPCLPGESPTKAKSFKN